MSTKYRGRKVSVITTFKESILINDEPQLLTEILKHLDYCKANRLLDPAIELETDRSTGQIKRLVKSWSDIQ